MSWLYVALGGAMGSVLRYAVNNVMLRWYGAAFPYGTLGVNVVGSLLMGLLMGWMLHHGTAKPMLHPLLAVGVLGGFTTFSAFSLDSIALIQRGDSMTAMLYVALSVGLSLIALAAGFALMKGVAA